MKSYFECHGHLFMNGHDFKAAQELHRHGVNRRDIAEKLALCRSLGIVYYRDGGDCLGVSEAAKEIAPEYEIDYRTPVFAIHKNGHYGGIVGKGFDTMQEYHALVLEVKRRGGDFIKIMLSGILDFTGDGSINQEPLQRQEIREMIHIAREEGFAVMAHVNGAAPVLAALEAGADSIEHGNFMEEECLQALAESQAVWVPTNAAIHNLLRSTRYDRRLITRLDELQAANIRRAARLGAMIAPGSDAGAFMVGQGTGTIDEEHRLEELLCEAWGKAQTAREQLLKGACRIQSVFRREPETVSLAFPGSAQS